MSDEPRFPPPRGEEPIGYRDAGAPASDDKPEPPVPSRPPLPRGKRVVASRPDDPDIAFAKAFTPPRTRPRPTSALALVMWAIVVIIIVAIEIASGGSSRRHAPSLRAPASVTT